MVQSMGDIVMNQTDMYLFLWELRSLTGNTDLIQVNHEQSHRIQEKELALVKESIQRGGRNQMVREVFSEKVTSLKLRLEGSE